LGASHAIALTSATCSGGKTARAARALSIAQPLQTLLKEASSPAADKLGQHPQASADLDVAQPISREQHKPGAKHLPMLTRVARRTVLQLASLRIAQIDLIPAAARHQPQDSPQDP
jgi:type VI protein secretion system component VasK